MSTTDGLPNIVLSRVRVADIEDDPQLRAFLKDTKQIHGLKAKLTLAKLFSKDFSPHLGHATPREMVTALVDSILVASSESWSGTMYELVADAIGRKTDDSAFRVLGLKEGLRALGLPEDTQLPRTDRLIITESCLFLLSCKTSMKTMNDKEQENQKDSFGKSTANLKEAMSARGLNLPIQIVVGQAVAAPGAKGVTKSKKRGYWVIRGQVYWAWLSGDPYFSRDLLYFVKEWKVHWRLQLRGEKERHVNRLLREMTHAGLITKDDGLDLNAIARRCNNIDPSDELQREFESLTPCRTFRGVPDDAVSANGIATMRRAESASIFEFAMSE